MDLYYDLSAALRLAEHAAAAHEHRAYGMSAEAVPALVWGKSSGAFLNSSGLPIMSGIYADGLEGPEADALLRRTEVGGDDFAQPIPLQDPITDEHGTTMSTLEWLRRGQQSGMAWLVIEVDRTTYSLALEGPRL
ncbi:hypothetical protein [Streptomyces sp. NRRL B-24484]|uniref:hypothetical protein n=1 Tax=Streptomyces sp. NRRL B-24484 TaxID=1463833 RepID=UPI0004C26745|nr:hypothetical protein [Streptomyces sp. NRRL B-24484]